VLCSLYASLSGWGYGRVVLRVVPPLPARLRRTGPALTCRAIACASACGPRAGVMRSSGFFVSRYSRNATAKRPLSEMPNSAAYRRPRRANSSGSRNVIAIAESLCCGITMVPQLGSLERCEPIVFLAPFCNSEGAGVEGPCVASALPRGTDSIRTPPPNHPASMKNLAACDRRFDHKLTPVGVPPQQPQG
jgi:hypothetical protein